MIQAKQLLVKLHQVGVQLYLDGGKLKSKGTKGAITPQLASEIKANKSQLMALLAQAAEDNSVQQQLQSLPAITRQNHSSAPLSFAQQRLWFVDHMNQGDAAYNIPVALKLKGAFNLKQAHDAISHIIQRHQVLRTVYHIVDGEVTQQLLDKPQFSIEQFDLTEFTGQKLSAEIERLVTRNRCQVVDINKDLMIKVSFAQLPTLDAEPQGLLLFNVHHIAADGWSMNTLVTEFIAHYQGQSLADLPIQYADYAIWQRQRFADGSFDQQKHYWLKQLEDLPPLHGLPTDFPRHQLASADKANGANFSFDIGGEISAQLQRIATNAQVTPFMLLHGVFSLLLARLSNQSDIVIGTPVANRLQPGLAPLIGCFVNTLVLRADVSQNPSFVDFLADIKALNLAAQANQDVPFEYLVEAINPDRSDNGHAPLFQIMLVMEKANDEVATLDGLTVSQVPAKSEFAKFDLTLHISETDAGMAFNIEYNRHLFKAERIENIAQHLQVLLAAVAKAPQTPIRQLPMLTANQTEQVLTLNPAPVARQAGQTIHALFEQQVVRTPDAIAVSCEGQKLSYSQLEQQANRLAAKLQTLGVGKDKVVGLLLGRSVELMVAIVATLKAGAGYLPLDPNYPVSRLRYVGANANMQVLLSSSDLQSVATDIATQVNSPVIYLDQADSLAFESCHESSHQPCYDANQLAYMIYTSGSTGQPKGVLIEHHTVVNLLLWYIEHYQLSTDDNVLVISATGFDLSQKNLLAPLLCGATVHFATKLEYDVNKIRRCINEQNISLINCAPSAFYPLVDPSNCDDDIGLYGLRYLLFGGEPIDYQQIQSWLEHPANQVTLVNMYGPTECTDIATYFDLNPAQQANVDMTNLPIGRANDNVRLYVLDEYQQLLPFGAVGELCIGGSGVTRGYHQADELNSEKFINVTLADGSIDRVYRSGDLVYWNADGQLVFKGRMDDQIKYRGYRIELAEISQQMRLVDGVKAALAVIKNDHGNEPRLVGYWLADDGLSNDEKPQLSQRIKAHLQAQLPDYMVPWALMRLDEFVLSANGKIDKKALPLPQVALNSADDTPLTGEQQHKLAAIWAQVLSLDVAQLSGNSQFFDLGGHSLLVVKLISAIRDQFGQELSVNQVFAKPTIATMSELLTLNQGTSNTTRTAIKPMSTPRDGSMLSYAQQRLWVIEQLQGPSNQYNIPLALKVTGDFIVAIAAQAFERIIARHESLRTLIKVIDEQPVQSIQTDVKFDLLYHDLSSLDAQTQQYQLQQLMTQHRDKVFDLANDLPICASFIQLDGQSGILLVNMHHICSDGWSMQLMINEFVSHYQQLIAGIADSLPPLPIQYADYANWQRQWLSGDVLTQQLDFWTEQLADLPAVHQLPTDFERQPNRAKSASKVIQTIEGPLVDKVLQLAAHYQITPFMLLHGALALLLSRHANQRDIVIGTPVANRLNSEVESLIGFFVNSLVLRTNTEFTQLSDYFAAVKQVNLDAQSHQDVPFEQIVDALDTLRTNEHAPLFQILFTLNDSHNNSMAQIDEVQFEALEDNATVAKYDLDIVAEFASQNEQGQKLHLSWLYDTGLFSHARIKQLSADFESILLQLCDKKAERLSDIQLQLSTQLDNALEQAFITVNSTTERLTQRFEQHVQAKPQATALSLGNDRMTYLELNQKANRVAHQLMAKGVGPDTLVGLCTERSFEMLIGLLGILKAGGAYVPLDPSYPEARLSYIVEDAQLSLVLADNKGSDKLADYFAKQDGQLLSIESAIATDTGADSVNETEQNPQLATLSEDNLAYIIYTSGSTGQPKGVMVEHRNMSRLFTAADEHFSFGADDVWTLFHSFAFDFSVWEIWGALAYGGELVIVPQQVSRDSDEFYQLLLARQVTVLNQTPAALYQLCCQIDANQPASKLRYVVLGGDALDQQTVKLWHDVGQADHTQLINMYGITETTVHVTYSEVNADWLSGYIGKPLNDLHGLVLDEDLNPVADGVAGELHVAGSGLTRGYLNKPQLTLDRFVQHQFSENGRSIRLYKTGDLVKRSADGHLYYQGRIDNQVKIRGFRIELGEIETQLGQLEGIEQAVVLAQTSKDNNKRLIAYINGVRVNKSEIQQALAEKLPAHMVPSVYIWLDQLPMTANGKIDRKALPQADESDLTTSQYMPPRNDLEQQLCAIWQQLLGLSQVGIEDNFFALGGDSILAIQMVSRARKQGLHLSVKQLFEFQTIALLSSKVGQQQAVVCEQGMVTGEQPLLPIQQHFFAQKWLESHHHNQSVLLTTPVGFTLEQLQLLVAALYQRHDVLRLRFNQLNHDSSSIAHYTENQLLGIEYQEMPVNQLGEIDQPAITAICQQCQASLNLAEGPLFKVVFFDQQGQQGRLLLVLHHLVVDGVSWRIIIADLEQGLGQLRQGQDIDLADKTSSYQQWANGLIELANSELLQQQRQFWSAQCAKANSQQPLGDYMPGYLGAHSSTAVERHTLVLDADTTSWLIGPCQQAYRSQINELLLSALMLAFNRFSGQSQLTLCVEGHGREDVLPQLDISDTVGWFTSVYPLVLEADAAAQDFNQLIKSVKEQYRQVPMNGLGFGLLQHYNDSQPALDFDWRDHVVFNYLGQFDTSVNQDTLFQAALEDKGQERSSLQGQHELISINGGVSAGQLGMSLSFDPARLASEAVQQLTQEFAAALKQIVATCQEVMENPLDFATFTPSDFANSALTQTQLDNLAGEYNNIERIYQATPMQQGMIFHGLLDGNGSSYTTQLNFQLDGELDQDRFTAAWQRVIARHPIFRTQFIGLDSPQVHQLVTKTAEFDISWHDWRETADHSQQFADLCRQDKQQGFDFAQSPLMRLHVVRLSDEQQRIIWSHHHVLLDGWCLSHIFNEVMLSYQDIEAPLSQVYDYEQYIAWLLAQDVDKAKAFWQQYLLEVEQPTPLMIDNGVSKAAVKAKGQPLTHRLMLDVDLSDKLNQIAKANQCTLNVVLQLAWAYLLHRYSGEQHVVFGATVSGRPAQLDGVEQMMGLFINTVAVKADFVDAEQSVSAALKQLHQSNMACDQHNFMALNEVQKLSQLAQGQGLFDSLIVFENYPLAEAMSGTESALKVSDVASDEQTNYALTLCAHYYQALTVRFQYNDGEFSQDAIERMAGHLQQILVGMADMSDQQTTLAQLPVLTVAEQQTLSRYQAETLAVDGTIHARFEAWAAQQPEALALTCGENYISYGQLNQKANQLAHYLIAQGVKPDSLVGLNAQRSIEMLIGLLAIVKAGGAYVPLDPAYPSARLDYMIADAKIAWVLTTDEQQSFDGIETIAINGSCQQFMPTTNPSVADLTQDNLAYIIYTSGSTGQPKGVMIEHRNITRLFDSAQQHFDFDANDVWTLFHAYAFDFSVWEIWGALSFGGRLLIVEPAIAQDTQAFYQLCAQQQVTVLNQTPGALQRLNDEIIAEKPLTSLRYAILGGDALDQQTVDTWYQSGQAVHSKLINMYGITETTVHVTFAEITRDNGHSLADIGKPLADLQAYVFDEQMNLLPYGVAGHLHIAGGGLARGYLHRPELTAERFINHQFAGLDPAIRLYKTGDLASLQPDGRLHYAGRIDHQVKIRGYRIELGEIQAQLTQVSGIHRAEVLAVDSDTGTKRLVAYLVASEHDTNSRDNLSDEAIKTQLSQQLPAHMVPQHFVWLEEIPLTVNGKIDRKALPAPQLAASSTKRAPSNKVETQLLALWQQVLHCQDIGIDDNFFALGGDSILSIQLVSRAKQQGLGFSVLQLFEHPTISQLALQVGQVEVDQKQQQTVTGTQLLMPIQQHFFAQHLPQQHHYNQSVLLRTPADFDVDKLKTLVAALYQRHDVLRLRFDHQASETQIKGQWQAKYVDMTPDLIEMTVEHQLIEPSAEPNTEKAIEAHCDLCQASLDLTQGPLFKALLLQTESGDRSRLLLVAHHLIIDGVSWRILLADLEASYRGQSLAAKTCSYQQYAKALHAYRDSDELAQQIDYWQQQSALELAPLPTETAKLATSQQLEQVQLRLPSSTTTALLGSCQQAYNTSINELLLTALLHAYQQFSGHGQLPISLESHGREALSTQLDVGETLGWFTTIYPLVLGDSNLAENDTDVTLDHKLNRLIKQVKTQYRQVPDNGIGYGILTSIKPLDMVNRSLSDRQIMFNYLGQFDNSVSDSSDFAAATESRGQEQSSMQTRLALLSIDGMVFEEQLSFGLRFDANRISKGAIEQLAQLFEQALIAVSQHCLALIAGQITLNPLSPADFPLSQLNQQQIDALNYPSEQIDNLYPATPMQQGFIFHGLLDGNGSSYTTQTRLNLNGSLDLAAFAQSWQQVVSRHDIFRTCFVGLESEKLHQLVVKSAVIDVNVTDWRGQDFDSQALDNHALQIKARGFDFAAPPLMQVEVVMLQHEQYHVIWSHHHVLLDGWCIPIVFDEVIRTYRAICDQQAVDLPAVTKYARYIEWLSNQNQTKAQQFWQDYLQGFTSANQLGIGEVLSAEQSQADSELEQCQYFLNFATDETAKLQQLAKDRHCTMNVIVQLAWAYLIHRYSGDEDVVFGATVSGRPADLAGVEQMMGLFINTVPVRLDFSADKSIASHLQQLHHSNTEAGEFSYLSLAEIQKCSALAQTNALFDTIVVFENYPLGEAMAHSANDEQDSLEISDVRADEHTNYGLSLSVSCHQQLNIRFSYVAEQFSPQQIEAISGHLHHILSQFESAAPLAEIEVVTPSERQQLLAYNQLSLATIDHDCLHQAFEYFAAITPNHCALVFEQQRLSYGELNLKANQLAHHLIKVGVRTGELVGLCLNRGIDVMVAILAIIKAGGAYVPLDPSYPAKRLAYMVEDAGFSLIVSESSANQSLPASCDTLLLDSAAVKDELANSRCDNPQLQDVNANNLAYMIYTSGSTGQPKGVLIEHAGAVNLARSEKQLFNIDSQTKVLQFASISFDAMVWEWISALCNGAALIMVTEAVKQDFAALISLVEREHISLMTLPPAIIESLPPINSSALKHVVFAGEALNQAQLNTAEQKFAPAQIVNAYGATENTVCATAFWASHDASESAVPVGRAIHNMQCYVLDDKARLQPHGVSGELYVGGIGVARGYWNKPQLSADKFVTNPLTQDTEDRLYRTGDMVKWQQDGQLVFVARRDEQVQLRGLRVELGEIEYQLNALPQIELSACRVIEASNGTQQLVAYVVAKTTIDSEQIQQQLATSLPSHMLPSVYIELEDMPLTNNGKIDHRSLPLPQATGSQQNQAVAPRNSLEQTLVELWQQVLKLDNVGIDDNFFALGGDSIMAIQLVARAKAAGLHFALKDLMQHPQISHLAALTTTDSSSQIDQQAVSGGYPLLPIQQAFLSANLSDSHHFNQSVLLNTPPQFNPQWLNQIIAAWFERHDVMRSSFYQQDGQWQVTHLTDVDRMVADCERVVNLSGLTPSQQASEIISHTQAVQTGFELANGPLFKAVYFQLDDNQGRLFLCAHHLIIDGVSWRILLSELESCYQLLKHGEKPSLMAKTESYQRFANHLADYASGEKLLAQQDYWQQMLTQTSADFGQLYQVELNQPQDLQQRHFSLTSSETSELLGSCNEAYRTQVNELLLTAVAMAFEQWSGQSGVQILLEGHGRDAPGVDSDKPIDVSETLGWFTNAYPLLLDVQNQTDFGAAINLIKEQYRAVPEQGMGYGVLRYLTDVELPKAAEHPVVFNYLGTFDNSINQQTAFTLADEAVGDNVSSNQAFEYLMVINAMVSDDTLRFNLTFDQNRIDGERIDLLMADLQQSLQTLCLHCLSMSVMGLELEDSCDSASDFDSDAFDSADDEILI